jgi:Mg2+ and Co2+ transporter CorA
MSWDHAEHLRHFPTPIPDAHDGDRAAPPPVTDALAVRFVADGGVVEAPVEEIPVLVKREDGFLWLDVPVWTSQLDGLLAGELGLHPVAREYCRVRNHMPMVHGYRDHVFMVLHRPVVLGRGETRLVELDLFVGDRFVVTVHKRDEASVAAVEGVSEVEETVARIGAGRIAPRTPVELTHALVSLMALRQRLLVQDVAVRVAEVEQKVLRRQMTNPEQSLEEMFLVRYELLSVRTTAAHSEEVLARARKLLGPGHHDDEAQLADLQDMFRRVHRMTDSEQELLAGVIDLYRTRNDTKMMIAMERLAVLAAVTLPITAIASVYGMNVIVNAQTHYTQLIIVLIIMAAISGILLRWTKKQGWW